MNMIEYLTFKKDFFLVKVFNRRLKKLMDFFLVKVFNRRLKKLIAFFILCVLPSLCSALTVTNLSVYPNPISPVLYDSATISFVLSEDPGGTSVELRVRREGEVNWELVTPDQAYKAGINVAKWTPGADGTYDVQVRVGGIPVAYGKITVDSEPPTIYDVSIGPTPFSPNSDGINDYVEVNFKVSRTPADEGCLGSVKVDNLGPPVDYSWEGCPGSGPGSYPNNGAISNVTGARLAVKWHRASTEDSIDLTIYGSYKRAAHSSRLELTPDVWQVTDEYYTYVSRVEVGSSAVVNDKFEIHWIAGDASVNIYDGSGRQLESHPAQPIFAGEVTGSGEYYVRFGGLMSYADGSYISRIQVTDAAGNVSIHSGIIVIDNVPISLQIVSVVPEFSILGTAERMARISPESKDGICDSVAIYYYLSDTAKVTAKVYDSDMNFVYLAKQDGEENRGNGQIIWAGVNQSGNVVNPSGEGMYTCVITAVDPQTSEAAEVTVQILVDNIPPGKPVLANISSPTNALDITVSGVAEPGSTIEVYSDDVLKGKITADLITGGFILPWLILADGRREITARAIDGVGNRGLESDPVIVLIDHTAPTITDNVPADWESDVPVKVTLNAVDEAGGSGVYRIYWEYNTANDEHYEGRINPSVEENAISFDNEGVYSLLYYAVDAAGNSSDKIKASNLIKIDTTAPGISKDPRIRVFGDNWELTEDLQGYFNFDDTISSPSLMIAGTASDSLSGVKQVMISIAETGVDWMLATGTSDWFHRFIPYVSVETNFTLKVKAIDNVDKESSVVEAKLTFTPPGAEVLEAAATTLSGGRIRLMWPAVSGASEYMIYRDTSYFEVIDDTKLWMTGLIGTVWVDGTDSGHPTNDGTKYYYIIKAVGSDVTYSTQAIADKTAPRIENIAASLSPFSPNGDRVDDSSEIFFTLTETTSVALNIYRYENGVLATRPSRSLLPRELFKISLEEETISGIVDNLDEEIISNILLREFASNEDYGITFSQDARVTILDIGKRWLITDVSESYTVERKSDSELAVKLHVFPAGDNFVEWDGKDDSGNVNEGRYVYRFEASETMDAAGNTLRQSISGDVWVLLIEFKLEDVSVTPTPFSPDGDKVRDVANISYYITDDADYVAGNIFSVGNGKQSVVAKIYVECLDYSWDPDKGIWTPYHVADGIRKGLSTEHYYLKPVNVRDPVEPPFRMSDPLSPPESARTVQDYLNNYQQKNPNWVPVSFSLQWEGTGAVVGASTYIIRLEAVKSNGAKTLPKTHEIVVESPQIVPNDKTPPVLKSTYPPASQPFYDRLDYVWVSLSDGQGTGVDLANSTVSLIGASGEVIPGQLSNDGKSTITLSLDKPLADNGSEDGTYTIVVSAVDYAKNWTGEIRVEFKYNTSVNDSIAPVVDGSPVAIDTNGSEIPISDGGVIRPAERIHRLKAKICDWESGINISPSRIELVKVVGMKEVSMGGERLTILESRNCGFLLLRLKEPLSINGDDDGVYKLIVRPADIAGNIAKKEFRFMYKTVEDTSIPLIKAIGLRGENGELISEKDSEPFDFQQVDKSIASIHAAVSDKRPSVGISFNTEKTYIKLKGPSGANISGQISYTDKEWTAEYAFADIVFTVSKEAKPLPAGNYTITIMVEDNAGNSSGEVNATFELVDFAIDDDDPPFIADVSVIKSGPEGEFVAGPICLGKYPYISNAEKVIVKLVDVKSGVDTQLSAIKLIEPAVRLRFSVDAQDLQGILDAKDIPGLRTAFSNNGIQLSENVYVFVEEESRRWLITDYGNKRAYTAKKEYKGSEATSKISVYDRYTVNGSLTAELAQEKSALLSLKWAVPLSINGWYTLDIFAVDKVRRLNSSIMLEEGDEMVAELDYGIVPEDIQRELGLSENVVVTVKETGCLWLITDQGQGDLNVYNSDGCRWRLIDDQRTYIIERKVWKEGNRITGKLDIYLSNSASVQIPDAFFFDNVPPVIDSVKAFLDENPMQKKGEFNNVRAAVRDDESGIDRKATSMILKDRDGNIIPGSLVLSELERENRKLEAAWLLKNTLKFEDGPYTVEVKTKDMAGNEAIDLYSLLFGKEDGTQAMRVYFVFPAAGELYTDKHEAEEKAEIFNIIPLDKVTVRIVDEAGVGFALRESEIDVDAPRDAPEYWSIKGYQTVDEAAQTITWNFRQSLATDGRADGEYRVEVDVKPKYGAKQAFYGYFIYDTQPPVVDKVEIGARPWVSLGGDHEPINGLRNGGTNRPLNRIDVKLKDALSGIDLLASKIELTGPNGLLTAQQSSDGIDTLVLDFETLSDNTDGLYMINITAVDSLGNSSDGSDIRRSDNANQPPYTYTFVYDTTPPEIVCAQAFNGSESVAGVVYTPAPATPTPVYGTCISTNPASRSLVLSKLDRIKVKLSDTSGVGIDLIGSVKTMFVYGPRGQVIDGNRDVEGSDTLVFKFNKPLSTADSFDDGVYTVKVIATDLVGNQKSLEFSYEYRALAPVLVDIKVSTDDDEVFSLSKDKNKKFQRSVTQVSAILEDRSGKGIDFSASLIDVMGPGVSNQDRRRNNDVDTLTYIFAQPLATDGTDDGDYVVFVRVMDKDGHWMDYVQSFVYDCTAPKVVSITPADGTTFNKPISEVSARLSDGTSQVDLFQSKITIEGPVTINATQVNNGVDTIILKFMQLAENGTADGRYEVSVDPVDILGNKAVPTRFSFIYDTKHPVVVSTVPSNNQLVTVPVDRVKVFLSDGAAGKVAGVDLPACSMILTGPDGKPIKGSLQTPILTFPPEGGRESGELSLILDTGLAVDGSADGTYTISVLTQDLIGNKSAPILSSFTYTTVSPTVLSTIPANNAQVRIPVSNIKAVLKDNSGAGLALKNSKVTLLAPDGKAVPGKHSAQEPDTVICTLNNVLATDGTSDGVYTLDILVSDKKGVSANYRTTFIYDRTPPVVKFFIPADGYKTNEIVDSVSVELSDAGSGVDLEGSKIELFGSDGVRITGSQVNDGISVITYRFTSSVEGRYTISVLPVDKVGNVSVTPETSSFLFDKTAPVIRQSDPADGATVMVPLDRVSVQLEDMEAGVDLGTSEIYLYSSDGKKVSGVRSDNGVDTLVLTFPALSANGSRNGVYTITVIMRDMVGNRREESVTFKYMPTAPRLAALEPNELYVSKSFKYVSAKLEDRSGSGIDFEKSYIKLSNSANAPVQGQMGNDKVNTLYLYLQNAFATDGSADSAYTVEIKAVDNRKNEAVYKVKFVWDTTPPRVQSTVPANGAVLNKPVSEVRAKLYDAGSKVDLVESVITLKGPVSIAAAQANDGVDTIMLKLGSMAQMRDGEYTILVDPADILGNRHPEPFGYTFKYDTTPPVVVSSKPLNGEVVTSPIKQVTVALSDMSSIDLGVCDLMIKDPNGKPVAGKLIKEEMDRLRFEIGAADLSSGGLDDGVYSMVVVTQDVCGNKSAPITLSFTYVTRAPGLLSTTPADGAKLKVPVSFVKAVLKDNSGAGLALEGCKVTLFDGYDRPVAGRYGSEGSDTVIYTLSNALATDGAADGIYSIKVQAVDKAGTGFNYTTSFVFDTTPPVVKVFSPADGHKTREAISIVSAEIEDAGSGVDLEGTRMELMGPAGKVEGSQVNDGINTVKYRFAAALGDGRYTIGVLPMDRAGNALLVPVVSSFVYDTKAPIIKQSDPADGATVVTTLERISVLLEDETAGVDTGKSGIRLYGPDGSQIAGVRDDGADILGLRFPVLKDNGRYSVTVTAVDRVGNVSGEYSFSFTYLPTAPSLVNILPAAFINVPVGNITAKLEDRSGSGIDFDNSWIKLWGPSGAAIEGELSNDGVTTLLLELQYSFPTDGKGDGEYTVEVRAVDRKKNEAIYKRRFYYDTTPCIVSGVYVGDLEINVGHAAGLSSGVIPSGFGAVDRVTVLIKDAGVGADLGLSKISLMDPKGTAINSILRNNGVDALTLDFDALGVDGTYTILVNAKDKLGNFFTKEKAYSFMLDTTNPKVSASTPSDGSMVVNRKLSEVVVQLEDGAGSGIDTGTSAIKVFGPNGEVKGTSDWGTGAELYYRFDGPLAMDGKDDGDYVIEVSFSDKAGNPAKPVNIHFTYDTVQPGGPVISNLGVFPKAFSPNGDGTYDSTTISYALSSDARVRLLVYNSSGVLAGTILDSVLQQAGMNSLAWDAKAGSLPDGAYSIKIDAVDSLGLTGAVESSSIVIDTRPPSVDQPVVSNNPFTPDGDGFADITTISFLVSGSEKIETGAEPRDSVAVTIYNELLEKIASLDLNRRFDGDGKYSATWNGDGASKDGEYSFTIAARDSAGNMREVSGTVSLDKNGPSIEVSNSYVLYTSQTPIILSGKAADWSGVRSVSFTEIFTPHGSKSPIDDMGNWVRIPFSGDRVDNDGDRRVDEEAFNGIDDDGDGLIDEDLAGKDKISDPVDWTYRLEPKVDGEYIIKFKASDSINHTTVQAQALRIIYDRTPPLVMKTTAAPSENLKNGDTVTVTTTYDEPGYKVMMDFAQLDSESAGPIKAEERGGGNYAVTYRISEKNTQPDGLKPVIISAEDTVGNKTVLDTLGIRLRNKLPTIVTISSDRRAYANGSLVKLWVDCDAADLIVSADFSGIDSTYKPEKVKVTNAGKGKYLVEYTIGVNNTIMDRQDITIPVLVSDSSAIVISEYKLTLDNIMPQIQKVRVKHKGTWREVAAKTSDGVFAANLPFANGSTIEIQAVWDWPGYSVNADFSGIDSGYRPGSETVTEIDLSGSEIAYNILYRLSSINRTPDGQDKKVIVKAVDLAGNESLFTVLVGLDNTPPAILSVTRAAAVYKNGDTVELLVKLDAGDCEVSADFSELDSQYPEGAKDTKPPAANGDGTYAYTVKYAISKSNTRASGSAVPGIHIMVTAADQAGNSATDSRTTVELDNLPPKLEIESPEPDVLVNSARLEIRGQTEPEASVRVNPEPSSSSLGADGKFSFLVNLDYEKSNLITVTATDVAGNQTTKEFRVVYRPVIKSAEGGTIHLPERKDDGIDGNETRIVVPPDALAQNFSIQIKQVESADPAVDNPDIGKGSIAPLIAYEFDLKDESGNHKLYDTFLKPVSIYLQYQNLRSLDGPAVVFRWDGVRWNKIGGEEDRKRNIVRITVNSLSRFGIFRGNIAREFMLKGAYPNPFTPNDDGANDIVSFYFDNPNNAEAVIRIFDLRGALIRKLENGFTSWDGRDEEGQPAEMGVYVYQVEVEDKVEGGTIVLAR